MHTQPLPSKKSNWWKWLLGIVFGLYVIGRCGSNSETSTDTSQSTVETAIDTSSGLASESTPSAPVTPASNWSYYEDVDKMGAKLKTASVDATELLDFEFPYNGGSTATLTIRKKGGSTDVYLKVSKGQFIVNVVDGGRCRVRFDSGSPTTYSLSGAADYSSDIVFIDNTKSFIKKAKSAKKMIIEVQFYNEGNRQIEFNIDGLKW